MLVIILHEQFYKSKLFEVESFNIVVCYIKFDTLELNNKLKNENSS